MPNNFLLTGKPGCGKTTLVSKVISRLKEKGLKVGGIFCPELREGKVRVGFMMVDLKSGNSKILAHVNERGPKVGKYRVNVRNVDEMTQIAIRRALEEDDIIVIDEIAPMEIYSEEFKKAVENALNSEKPLLAVIHEKSNLDFIGKIKRRKDALLFYVTPENRDELVDKLTSLILSSLGNTC